MSAKFYYTSNQLEIEYKWVLMSSLNFTMLVNISIFFDFPIRTASLSSIYIVHMKLWSCKTTTSFDRQSSSYPSEAFCMTNKDKVAFLYPFDGSECAIIWLLNVKTDDEEDEDFTLRKINSSVMTRVTNRLSATASHVRTTCRQ